MIKFPTRGSNTLDLFITNRPTLVTRSKAVPGVGDHDIVFVEVHSRALRKKLPSRKIHLWNKLDFDTARPLVSQLSGRILDTHTEDTDVETLWDSFKKECSHFLDNEVPSKQTSSRFTQPWINRKIKRLSRRKKRAYKKAKTSGNVDDTERYKRLQKDTTYECKKAYNTYIGDMVADSPKKLYSFISSKRCDSSGVPLLKKDGIGYSDPRNKASILNDQFCSVFTDEVQDNMPSMPTPPAPDMPAFQVHQNGIEKLLQELNPHKAQGPDNIPTRFLKEFAAELAPCLTLIFKASLKQGKVPSEWKQANVTALFKKGDSTSAANYRPISLTSVCCKLMEHVIHSRS